MTEYLALLKRKAQFLDVLDAELRDAEANKERENAAAVSIQRVFRGIVLRVVVSKQSYAVNNIQRCFPGHLGRKAVQRLAQLKLDNRRRSVLDFLCCQLQRCFRGYYSRKYKQDHARRKQYCRMIEERGRLVVEGMEQYFLEQADRLTDEVRQKRDDEFSNLAKHLHHLLSTQQIRGVYQPLQNLIEQPTMNRLPVEEHIRGVVKDLLRTRGITKRGLVPDVNGTLKIPLKGQKYRLSVQASAPYDAVRQAELQQKHLHKVLVTDKSKDFLAGGKTTVIDNKDQPLAVGDPYLDPWANPMLVKGVPANQKQLLESGRTHKALFVPPIDKPFVSRVGGNRSSALPNDVFDVIAEAEETGGAVHRHLGTTTARFGLPASADARYEVDRVDPRAPESTIPKAPVRTSSTLRSTTKRIRNYSDTGRNIVSASMKASSGRFNYIEATLPTVDGSDGSSSILGGGIEQSDSSDDESESRHAAAAF